MRRLIETAPMDAAVAGSVSAPDNPAANQSAPAGSALSSEGRASVVLVPAASRLSPCRRAAPSSATRRQALAIVRPPARHWPTVSAFALPAPCRALLRTFASNQRSSPANPQPLSPHWWCAAALSPAPGRCADHRLPSQRAGLPPAHSTARTENQYPPD